MGEAYTKLVMPLPVGESQKNMERQRKQYANGELKAPVPYPEGVGPGTYEPEPGKCPRALPLRVNTPSRFPE